MNHKQKKLGRAAALLLGTTVLLSSCTSPPRYSSDALATIGDSRHGPRGKAGHTRPYRVNGKIYHPLKSAKGYRAKGLASWYGWESGKYTATGSRFNPRALTAAHRTLPLPSRVRVTNLANRRSVVLLVNDRGPFVSGRLIDLSYGAAKVLGIRGVARVEVVALE